MLGRGLTSTLVGAFGLRCYQSRQPISKLKSEVPLDGLRFFSKVERELGGAWAFPVQSGVSEWAEGKRGWVWGTLEFGLGMEFGKSRQGVCGEEEGRLET